MKKWLLIGWMACSLMGCTNTSKDAAIDTSKNNTSAPQQAPPKITASSWQRGQGQPYEVLGSQVWDVPDPVSGRDYQVFVALPASYTEHPERHYPVLYVTDADYAFPIVRQIARRLNVEGPSIAEFILVGLSYAKGDGGMQSRRRDYTPTPVGPKDAPADAVHGQSSAYIAYPRASAAVRGATLSD